MECAFFEFIPLVSLFWDQHSYFAFFSFSTLVNVFVSSYWDNLTLLSLLESFVFAWIVRVYLFSLSLLDSSDFVRFLHLCLIFLYLCLYLCLYLIHLSFFCISRVFHSFRPTENQTLTHLYGFLLLIDYKIRVTSAVCPIYLIWTCEYII